MPKNIVIEISDGETETIYDDTFRQRCSYCGGLDCDSECQEQIDIEET